MPLDLLFPFGILIAMVVYFIYSRSRFEKDIVHTYEQKFEEWKKHNSTPIQPPSHKELVGLVFKKDGKIDIELFDEIYAPRIQKGKFDIKVK